MFRWFPKTSLRRERERRKRERESEREREREKEREKTERETERHTHTLAQKYLIELLMWNASYVQKTFQLNLTGDIGVRKIFLCPC